MHVRACHGLMTVMKLSSLQLYLVISQLLFERSSFLAVTRGLLHCSSDVLQSLLCLDLDAKQDTLFIFYNLMIPDDPSIQTSTHVAADFQLSSTSIPGSTAGAQAPNQTTYDDSLLAHLESIMV